MQDRPDIGFVCGSTFVVDSGNQNIIFIRCLPPNIRESFNTLYLRNFIPVPTVMVRRSCLDRIGVFDERLSVSEDYDLWLRLAKKHPFEYLREPLARYRFRTNGLGSNTFSRYKAHQHLLRKPEILYDINRSTQLVRRAMMHYYFGEVFLKNGRCFYASLLFFRSLLLFPLVGAYCCPFAESRDVGLRFYKLLEAYWLPLLALVRGIMGFVGFKVPIFNFGTERWESGNIPSWSILRRFRRPN